jgi:hypothetical protein
MRISRHRGTFAHVVPVSATASFRLTNRISTLRVICKIFRGIALLGSMLTSSETHPRRAWIAEALRSATAEEIRGEAITPYLLDYLARASRNPTLTAQIGLEREAGRFRSVNVERHWRFI